MSRNDEQCTGRPPCDRCYWLFGAPDRLCARLPAVPVAELRARLPSDPDGAPGVCPGFERRQTLADWGRVDLP